jgi:O-antigen/teichoic acid export membrane protein
MAVARRDDRHLWAVGGRGREQGHSGLVTDVSSTDDLLPGVEAGVEDADPSTKRHLNRSLLSLVVNTVVTGALGILFWIVAAKSYPDRQVGTAVAATSLLLLLAFAAQLNMASALSRFLPGAGSAQRSYLLLAYRWGIATGIVVAAAVVGIAALRGGSIVRGGDGVLTALIAISIPVWVVFSLQDTALVAARRPTWVPVENALVALAKFALLPVFISLASGSGMVLAWVLPVVVAIPVVNVYLFGWVVDRGRSPVPSHRQMLAYALWDMPGMLALLIAMRLVPVIIVELGSQGDAAYIGVPWSIIAVAALSLKTLSLALLAEISRGGEDPEHLSAHASRLILTIMVPIVVIGTIVAVPLLSFAGQGYESRGSAVLIFGLWGLVPAAYCEVRLAVLRAANRVGRASAIQVVRSAALLGTVIALVTFDHPEQIGIAFLVVNALTAFVMSPIFGRNRTWETRDGVPSELAPSELAPPAVASGDVHSELAPPAVASGDVHSEFAPPVGAPVAVLPPPSAVLPPAPRVAGMMAPVGTGAAASRAPEIAAHFDDSVTAPVGTTESSRSERNRRATQRRRRRTRVVSLVLLVLGVVVAAMAMADASVHRFTSLGLISGIPWTYFVGVGVVIVGILVSLDDEGPFANCIVFAQVGALLVLLHGLPGIIEANPRFQVAWLHVGFADQIAQNGSLLGRLDARFSWAGFFAGTGLLQRVAGTESTLWLVRYAPVAINAFACWAIVYIGRAFSLSRSQRILAVVLFVVANWSGQDYYSPQATTFCLYLVFVTLVVWSFRSQIGERANRLARWFRADATSIERLPTRETFVAYGSCLVLLAGMVTGHQLTPVFLTMALLALTVFGAIRTRALAFIVGTAAIVWISYGAQSFWVGHFDKILGSPGSVVQQNIGKRAGSADVGRQTVLLARLALGGMLFGGAFAAASLMWRRHRLPIVLLCLWLAPFPAFVVQPYGGEMLIRVYLFTLPIAAVLVSLVAVPRDRRVTLVRRVILAVLLVGMVPLFVLARFGNEKFEYITDADLAVAEVLFANVPRGSEVFVANRHTLQYAQRVDEIRFRSFTTEEAADIADEVETFKSRIRGPKFVMLSESQEAYGQLVGARPPGWIVTLRDELIETGKFQLVDSEGDASLLRLVERRSSP